MGVNKISQTGIGSSVAFPIDYTQRRTLVSLGIKVTGTATYTIQFTMEDVLDDEFNSSTAEWLPLGATSTNATVSNLVYNAFACGGLRVTISSGTGTVDVTILQSGVG